MLILSPNPTLGCFGEKKKKKEKESFEINYLSNLNIIGLINYKVWINIK